MGRQGKRALLVALLLMLPRAGRAEAPKERPVNRLARETSPYLLQHAHNPVDWFPWGEEAFAKAKKDGKLVFLSIGYSSCYWCHVMERESFENASVAKLLNDWFVCIKVDREERPDIDQVYMTALNALGQRGGWPLSMFLTADGKPLVGGTYWPPEDKEVEGGTLRGFKTILKAVHDAWSENPKGLEEKADKLAEGTRAALAGLDRGVAVVGLERSLVQGVVDGIKEEFDKVHGGFGSPLRDFKGTKFPMPPYLELLLDEAGRTKSEEAADMVTHTLDAMARGGIYDQLGGGFHRYSTERTWTVPHFEKMLYDNAQLAELYARAYRRTKSPLYRRVVQETLTFVGREMTSPEGAFYSALDAETGGQEGRFYVWTDAELRKALPDPADASLFRAAFGAGDRPNFEERYHILTRRKLLAEAAREAKVAEEQAEARVAALRERLFALRAERSRPFLDTKVLTAWNGQMIAGYAVAGLALDDPAYRAAAKKAAEFVLAELRGKDGRLLRAYGVAPGSKTGAARLNAYLDDYAYLIHGLLCLHDVTNEPKWLDEAKALTDVMVQRFGDERRGGFYYTSNDHEQLFARAKDQYDGVQPSGNSVAARNLVRLWVKTGDERYRVLAENTLKAFAGAMKLSPTNLTAMARALDSYLDQGAKPAP